MDRKECQQTLIVHSDKNQVVQARNFDLARFYTCRKSGQYCDHSWWLSRIFL